jgi:hypothetical protein
MDSPDPSPPGAGRRFRLPRVEILRLDFSKRSPRRPSEPVEDRGAECDRVLRRLLAILREHRASARRVGSPLDREAVLTVIAALRLESFGGDPRHLLRHPDPVAAWLRETLYQDLLEEPSNVLFTTRIDDETVRYEAMAPAFWRECLEALEERVAGD